MGYAFVFAAYFEIVDLLNYFVAEICDPKDGIRTKRARGVEDGSKDVDYTRRFDLCGMKYEYDYTEKRPIKVESTCKVYDSSS